ncbi:MAG: D-alanine--D-alanine ligase [Desulfovibrio sp.]|nr:D-alanine--D-alanine ligase [Desulfovibrio sp.]
MRILLLAGGWSTEREISLSGAKGMATAIESLGHSVTLFDLKDFDKLLAVAKEHDLAIINLHGQPGEDGLVQAMLDSIGVPYQGTGPAGSFLALNKAASKQVLRHYGVLTPDWEFLPKRPSEPWQPRLPFPLFVKSDTGGSSIHLAKVTQMPELLTVMEEIFQTGCGVLVEEAIAGREVTCGILGEQALPPVLIEPVQGSFFDYTSKYAVDGAREICPAPLAPELLARIQKTALDAHRILGLDGLSRSDFILDAQDRLYLLEVNTLPGMTATSLVPREAKALGMSFPALMQRFIDLALAKKQA